MAKPRALEEWLQAKLDDPWGGDNISTLLTADQLNEVASRWSTFDSQIRVKLLIAILNMKKKHLTELKDSLMLVLKTAADDPDDWVRVMVYLLDGYVETRQVNVDLAHCNNKLGDAYRDLCETLDHGAPSFIPLEAMYLNTKDGSETTEDNQTANTHFTLRNPPKSEKLWAELDDGLRRARNPDKEMMHRRMSMSTGMRGAMQRRPLGPRPSVGALPPRPGSMFVKSAPPTGLTRRNSGMNVPGSVGAKKYVENKKNAVMLEMDESLTLAATAVKRKKTDEELRAEEEERLQKRKDKIAKQIEEKERKKLVREQQREQRKAEKAESRRKSTEAKSTAATATTGDDEEGEGDGATAEGAGDEEQAPEDGPVRLLAGVTPENTAPATQAAGVGQEGVAAPGVPQAGEHTPSAPAQAAPDEPHPSNGAAASAHTPPAHLGGHQPQPQQPQLQQAPGGPPAAAMVMAALQELQLKQAHGFKNLSALRAKYMQVEDAIMRAQAANDGGALAALADSRAQLVSTIQMAEAELMGLQQQQQRLLQQQQMYQQMPGEVSAPYAGGFPPQPAQHMVHHPQVPHGAADPAAALFHQPAATAATHGMPYAGPGVAQAPSVAGMHPATMTPQLAQTLSLTNKLTPEDRDAIVRFIQGERDNTAPATGRRQIVMHEEHVMANGQLFLEQIIFDMDYQTRTWKRLKRKRPIKM